MVFEIKLQSDVVVDRSGAHAFAGRIRLGDHEEDFFALAHYWTWQDYTRQWIAALRTMVAGRERGCLITSYLDPAESEYLFWWPMYRDGSHVVFHNQILFFHQLAEPFDAARPEHSVGPRIRESPEGGVVSEWTVPLDAVAAFLALAGE